MNTAIVLSAGSGSRMQSKVKKQYMMLLEKPLVYYSLKAFDDCEKIDDIIVVAGRDDIEYFQKEIIEKYNIRKVTHIVEGGKERYNSVYNGLKYAKNSDYVLIHDGARAFVTVQDIKKVVEEVMENNACVAAVKTKDTVKISDEKGNVISTPDRKNVWIVQTPQAFKTELIIEAYEKMIQNEDKTITDDSMVMEKYGNTPVRLTEVSYENIKVTTPDDLIVGEGILKKRRCI